MIFSSPTLTQLPASHIANVSASHLHLPQATVNLGNTAYKQLSDTDSFGVAASHFGQSLWLPHLPEMTMPLQEASLNLDVLNQLGLPPAVVGGITAFVVFPFKIEVAAIVFASLAFYYRATNKPRHELSAHIKETNQVLPELLKNLGQLQITRIQNKNDAQDVTQRLTKLYLYATPHPIENNGRAYRNQKPLLQRFFLTRPLSAILEFPSRKIRKYLERKVVVATKPQDTFLAKNPETKTLWQKFKQKMQEIKQRLLRDAITVMKGEASVVNYADIKLTPENIGAMTLHLGGLVLSRLRELKNHLDDPNWYDALTPQVKKDLSEEIALYGAIDIYTDYPAIEAFRGTLIDVEMRLANQVTNRDGKIFSK